MTKFELLAVDEPTMLVFAGKMAQHLRPSVIYLEGDLGAGKTTFSRGLIQALGHTAAVKSPTFTLVEPYEFSEYSLYHFDLYRLIEPEELEYVGVRDYFSGEHICLIEWPSKGVGHIPAADLVLQIKRATAGHRNLELQANSALGETLLAKIAAAAA